MKKWLEQADDSGVRYAKQIAKTIRLYQWGILNWYDHPISNGVVEGINNKIKVLKRIAYGYRDMDYFQPLLSDKSFSAKEESFISSDSRVPSLSDFRL